MAILIIDLGGQYCHLIKRTLDDLHIAADIRSAHITPACAKSYDGIILSGGPLSVYEADSPSIDSDLLNLGIPVLGICYGHQLLARMLGATVEAGTPEYGNTEIVTIVDNVVMLDDTPDRQIVWMSHGDTITDWPEEIIPTSMSRSCLVTSFCHVTRPIHGLQFHPEVVHTQHGRKIIANFVQLCGAKADQQTDRATQIIRHIQHVVGDKSVMFFVSGGVDSTVAFALCAKALPKEKLHAVYVDTGFMRKHETQDIMDMFDRLGMNDRLHFADWSQKFMDALAGVVDPEEKRKIIGDLFVEVQQAWIADFATGHLGEGWLLGQGTIYPDTIESGAGSAATIKTHHNQCEAIRELTRQGRVIEPLRDLYKDQVREIGKQIGIPQLFIDRWPFPGPGLAIRCLCTHEGAAVEAVDGWEPYDGLMGLYGSVRVPLRSVGVQGDARTYRATMAVKGPLSKYDLMDLARLYPDYRIIAHIGGDIDFSKAKVVPATLTTERIAILREADFIVRAAMIGHESLVWQFPVVMIPLQWRHGETIVLRPIMSSDGMTANFVIPPNSVLERITDGLLALPGVDAVFIDVSDKPPATIEWE